MLKIFLCITLMTSLDKNHLIINIIVPLVILVSVVTFAIFALNLIKKNEAKKNSNSSQDNSYKTAQEFINIVDIDDNFLYTDNGMAIIYIRVQGLIIDLLSKSEQEILVKQLAADFSDINFPFKHISVSRPVDISPTLTYWHELLDVTDCDIRKMLLKNEISELGKVALSAHIVERQHYISFWDHLDETGELLKKAFLLVEKFKQNNIDAHILNNAEIVRLINLIHNPNYVHLENTDYEATLPIINANIS